MNGSTLFDRREILTTGAAALAAQFALPTSPARAAQHDDLRENIAGGYRFLPGIAAFSEGAIALPGFAVVHARFSQLVTLDGAYTLVERELKRAGRPMSALCGMELRVPRQFTIDEFRTLNRGYIGTLRDKWQLFVDGTNPVPRCNLALRVDPANETSLYGFSYTVTSDVPFKTFVTAGINDGVLVYGPNTFTQIAAGEALTRLTNAPADNDLSEANTRRRLDFILDQADQRLRVLGVAWSDATQVDMFIARPFGEAWEKVVLPRLHGSAQKGVRWHYGVPPFQGPQVEMDVRAFIEEKIIHV